MGNAHGPDIQENQKSPGRLASRKPADRSDLYEPQAPTCQQLKKAGSYTVITQEKLKERLQYNPDTGIFFWLNGWRKGNPAGSKNNRGYLLIKLVANGGRKDYLAHRLAWLYVYGVWPSEIDHINRDRSDNRLVNLRLANRSQTRMNSFTKNDVMGFRGTSWNAERNKWRAEIATMIGDKRKRYFLGYFDTREQAAAAYQGAAAILHREFRRNS